MNKRYIIANRLLIFWTVFIGFGAVFGSLGLLCDPSGKFMGMDKLLPYFQVLPFAEILFQNYIFSGIMLFIVNGLTNIVSAVLLFAKKKLGIILGLLFGITLMMWIIIQFIIFPFNIMSTSFFIFGFLQFVTGVICLIGWEQSQFKFDEKNYKNVGVKSSKIVIFFSRTGYTKKLAFEIADTYGAEILEIKTSENISGNWGFWWCGRFGMHRWGMKLEPLKFDPSKYEEIILCSPVWVFALSSPMREFCKIYSGKLNNVSYVITHFMNCKFEKIAKEMDAILKTKHNSLFSYKCHFGKLKKII